jgi:hypothetical protein
MRRLTGRLGEFIQTEREVHPSYLQLPWVPVIVNVDLVRTSCSANLREMRISATSLEKQ